MKVRVDSKSLRKWLLEIDWVGAIEKLAMGEIMEKRNSFKHKI